MAVRPFGRILALVSMCVGALGMEDDAVKFDLLHCWLCCVLKSDDDRLGTSRLVSTVKFRPTSAWQPAARSRLLSEHVGAQG